MKKILSLFIAPFLSLASANVVWAWGDLGHQIVGNIAEQRITPATKDFVRGVLGIEPMAVAANWPDHVRDDARFGSTSDPNFDFAPYHFAEIPTGYTYDTRPNKDEKDAYGAMTGAVQMLIAKNVPREKKMIAMRYLIHIVGDIHQPLHIGNDYDRGGNNCIVRYGDGGKTGNFHSFWDDDMVTKLGLTYVDPSNPKSRAPFYYPDYVTDMKTSAPGLFNSDKPVVTADSLPNQLKSWMNESAQLREKIYPDALGGNPNAYKLRKYCQWFTDQNNNVLGETSIKSLKEVAPEDIPVLDQNYVNRFTKSIVEPQLIKAGVRLAGVLDYVASAALKNDPNMNQVTDSLQNQTILEIQNEFSNH